VAPVVTGGTGRAIHIPKGTWVDYWTGASVTGPIDTTVDVPLDRIPLFVRAGAIVPKIPEDVMTLVPKLDDRRIYEVYPGPARSITDFEGRHLTRSEGRLEIAGRPARITVAFRFTRRGQGPVLVNGKRVAVDSGTVTFAHAGHSEVTW
jgi:alpha-D-xyloside xylohydrolase